jgi:PHD/YefM family antitoxin component YafN of YafNO toxin-antitoxin module
MHLEMMKMMEERGAEEKEVKDAMGMQILDSNRARAQWRDVLDMATTGAADVVIERYGKPVATVIAYDDYIAMQDELDELRAARRAAAIYEEWTRDRSIARPYTEFRAGLIAEGILHDNQQPLEDTPGSSS